MYRPPQLAASFISNQACDVRNWHLADNPTAPALVRYWFFLAHMRSIEYRSYKLCPLGPFESTVDGLFRCAELQSRCRTNRHPTRAGECPLFGVHHE